MSSRVVGYEVRPIYAAPSPSTPVRIDPKQSACCAALFAAALIALGIGNIIAGALEPKKGYQIGAGVALLVVGLGCSGGVVYIVRSPTHTSGRSVVTPLLDSPLGESEVV